MTKEDKGKILRKHFPIPGNHPDSEAINEAMDEYAKQQAIAFSEWCASNYQRDFEPLDASLPINERKYRQFWIDNNQREYSSEQLYNQFIEQQNKPCPKQ